MEIKTIKSQKQRVLERLMEGGCLSTLNAIQNMQILRLGAIIFKLKKEGYDIGEREIEGGRYGEYWLIKKELPKLPPAFPTTVIQEGKDVRLF